ncbi:type 1 glutamine amidotransferase [Corynebacterium liangguodongii]|uniref:Lipid II isoglutaminyl synthase (glutamine-hydrolyzing) subunit GatD n=1 Tax=Corynebacterium liangguodongii TaxID=2079535 RepID=A0A2S0WBR5_9CORY|nr:glutamine amidotransferase [Corynebacterium liangguodongii]AWB83194.1 glutamine amidotransferase [Corynebacterium liangguodongii]PWB98789.1 glutamine amidotransferase [Corynebacterium liangguodongii]
MAKRLRIGLVLPDVLGTYGDDGNALVLRQRARMRGMEAEIERIGLGDDVPADCDVYTIGGGEDAAQIIASSRLKASPGLQSAAADGRPIFAVCAGMQVLGHAFTAHGETVEGLGLIDATTTPMTTRAIGEVASHPTRAGITAGLTEPLTGFENHMGGTVLGPEASALGTVKRGVGNAENTDVEGVVQGSIIATYMHGPALARNPQLADLLMAKALGIPMSDLEPLELAEIDRLRLERMR